MDGNLLLAVVGDVGGHSVFAVHDHGEGLAVIGLLERRRPTHQHEEDHPQAPDICGPETDKASRSSQ